MRKLGDLFTSPTVVTCSSTHPELASSLSCSIVFFPELCFLESPPNAAAGTQVLALTLSVWFRRTQSRTAENRGTWCPTGAIFRLISYPCLHWTPHLLLVITAMPELSGHTTTSHPCSFPQKSRIIGLAFGDLHTWYWLPIVPFSCPTLSPCVDFRSTVLLSTPQYALQKLSPPCLSTNVSLCLRRLLKDLPPLPPKPHSQCWKESLFPILSCKRRCGF